MSAAGASVLSAFFGDRGQIDVTSDTLPGTVRSFTSFGAIATEAGLSRVYAGQHTPLDDAAGQEPGRPGAPVVFGGSESQEFCSFAPGGFSAGGVPSAVRRVGG